MELCRGKTNNYHDAIAFEYGKCPLCMIISRQNNLKSEVEDLQKDLKEANEIIYELESQIKEYD